MKVVKAEQRVIDLLKSYRSNSQKLKKLERDETIREWKMDYKYRIENGGINSPKIKGVRSSDTKESMQEKLMLERENVLSMLEKLRLEVEVTKLLLFQLNEDQSELIRLRYIENFQVHQICAQLYISKSSFYRRHTAILNQLTDYYRNLKK